MNTQSGKTGEGDVDVVVIGVGTSGEDLSLQLLDAGLKVVGIANGLVGGECAYWGCIPSKMMIRAANTLHEARQINSMAGHSSVTPDWGPVAARLSEATSEWDDAIAIDRYEKRGGRLIKGIGRITGPRTVTVGDESITARYGIVVATGSKPFIPPIQGLSEVDYWTTYDVMKLKKLPESLIILGGGAIGCELGQVMARFGVDVKIIERNNHLLDAEEPEVSTVLERTFADEGISVFTKSNIREVRYANGLFIVVLEDGKEITSERLLVATGRKADISKLGLEAISIPSTSGTIQVDERMRAGDGIWAMGDVTGKGMFTHVALHHSAIVASDILGRSHPPASYHAVPRVVYSDPEVGAVGMTESEARKAGIEVTVIVKQLPVTFRGWIHAIKYGVLKLVIDRNNNTLLGASMAGPNAGEVVGLLTLAVHARMPIDELRNMIYAYPTFYGGLGEAIGAYGRGLTTIFDPEYKGIQVLDELMQKAVKE
jgi:pyruvate/2-oxoglutarate dehydrogenase complex dihydrolipoamide dehydrogenase (E3) component